MLYPVKEKSAEIVRAERRDDRLYLHSEAGMYRLEPKDSGTLRITYTQGDRFSGEEKPGVIFRQVYAGWEYWENDREIGLVMEQPPGHWVWNIVGFVDNFLDPCAGVIADPFAVVENNRDGRRRYAC